MLLKKLVEQSTGDGFISVPTLPSGRTGGNTSAD